MHPATPEIFETARKKKIKLGDRDRKRGWEGLVGLFEGETGGYQSG
jgi:hypothetical protein